MSGQKEERKLKERFPKSVFAIYFGILLLMSGIHTGIIIYMHELHLYEGFQTVIPVIYWGCIAFGLTLFTRKKIQRVYEEPLQEMAIATRQVAGGDFSVYLPTIHSADKLDYLDYMIIDFNKMVEELGSIETLKTDFISNVSHEMKTPIAQIENYAQLLKKDHCSKEEQMEYADTIHEAAMRMNLLITNILKLNKLEHQTMTQEPEIYDVCEQICNCIFFFETKLDEKEIELETNLDERIYINADQSMMELVWNNLLSNAIKFSPKGGVITIHQSVTEKTVRISVKDQGVGMEKEVMEHIFDKFYQGDTSHASEGNGLGLALARRVVELMNGKIWAESKVNEGSTFYVELPRELTNGNI